MSEKSGGADPKRTRRARIAGRLEHALEARKMTLWKFQKLMKETDADGTSYPAIHRALKAETEPSVAFLENAADVLSVRRAWLTVGDGPMEEEKPTAFRETFSQERLYGAFLPVQELNAWHELVASLELRDDERTALSDMAFVISDAMAIFDIGEVRTHAGERVYRPAPEFKEAMRLELSAAHLFLSQWIAEWGVKKVRAHVRGQMPDVVARFARPMMHAGLLRRLAQRKQRR